MTKRKDQSRSWLVEMEVTRRVTWIVEATSEDEAREKANAMDIQIEEGGGETTDWRVISVEENK